MTPPSLPARIVGHAIVVLPMSAATLWSVYAMVIDQEAWPITAVMLAVMHQVMKANQQVASYKAWQRQWDSMAPARADTPRRGGGKHILAIGLVVAVIAYLALTRDQPSHALALDWIATVAVVISIIMALRSLFRRRLRQPRATPAVAVCVTKPLLAVPALRDAYHALPAYCVPVLGRSG